MASQILQDIPNVIPLFPLDGSEYAPSQRIQIEIPSSVRVLKPGESYLSIDVTFPELGEGTNVEEGIVGAGQTSDVLLSYTNAPQTWGCGGAHGMFRDVAVYSMGTGQEIDRINFYNVACRGMLPFMHGKDECSTISQEQGLCLWRPETLDPNSQTRLNNQLSQPVHPFDLQYFHECGASPNMNSITASNPRTQRYSLPFRFGFMSSEDEFLNLGGLRLDILLDTAQRSLEFYNSVVPTELSTIKGAVLGGDQAAITTNLNRQWLLGLANHYPVGTVVKVTSAGIDRIRTVAGYTLVGNAVSITFDSVINFLAADANAVITFPAPTSYNGMDFSIQNVALYVRQLAVNMQTLEMKFKDMDQASGGGYSFRSLYNYPLNIVANQSNPVLNYNIVPLKYAQGLVFVPTCDTDVNSLSARFPGRLATCLLSSATTVPGTTPNKIQYQVKIGNQYVPLQPTDFSKLVPQVLAKEMESFVEVCLGNGMMTNQPYSLDTINSVANQTTAGILQFYNRPIACVMAPNAMSAMDISTQNIQLLLFSGNAADASAYTVHLFASHMKHIMNSPVGLVVDC